MTKFILHGGGANLPLEGNKRFFGEITSSVKDNAKVLLVYLAREESDWIKFFEQDKLNFSGENLRLEIANSDPIKLREQIRQADAIYVKGGNTFMLLEKIKQLSDFADLIKDKVYAGSSAGAYLVCKYFYENDLDKTGEGLGILPIKCLAHWTEKKEKLFEVLMKKGEDLPIYKLAEGEYIIIDK